MVDELREQRQAVRPGSAEAAHEGTQAEAQLSPDELLAQLEAARAEAADNWDKYLRCRAEMDNYRRRVEATYAQLARESRRAVLRRFIDVLDNLDRAIASGDGSASPTALLAGVELTRKQFLSVLEQEGVRPIPAIGQQFDPRLHEAVGTAPSAADEGTVVHEARRGYTVDDDLLRPARVIVATHEGSAG